MAVIYKIDNVKLNLLQKEDELYLLATRKLGKKPSYFRILKKSLDARKKNDIHYVYTIEFSADNQPTKKPLERIKENNKKIFIVGSGPAGLFCAIRLIDRGFAPIIIERGQSVEERMESVNVFSNGGALNLQSNVQFGEGGAGTFSDGKLNTQTHNGYNAEVLQIFERFGAPKEILYLNKPHIGSDKLREVLLNIRKYILSNGGEFRFSTLFDGIDGKVCYFTDMLNNIRYSETPDILVLAIGHSARDTFQLLRDNGVALERRDFAVGVRIEHLQSDVGYSQYGKAYDKLPPADYKLVSHAGDRTAFTFCMCPGGYVMPATSEFGGVVTNGMSNYARDGENANSALLVQIDGKDFGSEDLFAGVEFQREVEKHAFTMTSNYKAPVQLIGDFLKGKTSSSFKAVKPTYSRGVEFVNLRDILPRAVTETLTVAIPDMAKRLKCFDSADGILTGVETRFSSPIRILRNDYGQSVTHSSIYPCGEGSGYSGGITSSASDGIRTADKIYNKYK